MRVHLHAAPVLLIVMASSPEPGFAQDDTEGVLQAQTQRFAAMVSGDLNELEQLLSPDLIYTHTTGTTETKAEFLTSLRLGSLSYESIVPDHAEVRIFGQAAISLGTSAMHVMSDGQEFIFSIRFLEAYVRRDGRWLLTAWQSTRLPAG